MKHNRKLWIPAVILLLVAVVFTFEAKTADRAAIGVLDSSVGLASLNGPVADWLGFRPMWYDVTKVLTVFSFAVLGCFALVGAVQLFKRKGLFKVDPEILVLGGFYLVVLAFYVFFNKVIVINYRPIILDPNEPFESSFPSSHTVMVISIFATAMMLYDKYLGKKPALCKLAKVISVIIMVLMVAGRFLSGVHWLTDIIGGLLWSAALVTLFGTVKNAVTPAPSGLRHTA